jgi:mannitol-1-phosphate 5-dehydrogenase
VRDSRGVKKSAANHRPRAVVFGAGKMACGLLGPLLSQAGYETLFIARREEVVVAINWNGGYRLTITTPQVRSMVVRHCSALRLAEAETVTRAVAGADLVMTGLGIDNLWTVAPFIAEGLWQRCLGPGARPLNVVACENLPGAGAYLHHMIIGAASAERSIALESVGGFSAGLTRRIMTGGELQDGELRFAVSGPPELVLDIKGLKGTLPRIPGVTLTEDFAAFVIRKLFTLNLAQAVAAYLGYHHDCRYVHEAAMHPAVAPVVHGAVNEACAALQAEFPRQHADIATDARQALSQIGNADLSDLVRRVARDPRRKLSALERLVGPARLAGRHGLPYSYLSAGIAAALAYDEPEDVEARALQHTIKLEGIEKVLTVDCGLLPHEPLARAVKEQWCQFMKSTNGGEVKNGSNKGSSRWTRIAAAWITHIGPLASVGPGGFLLAHHPARRTATED